MRSINKKHLAEKATARKEHNVIVRVPDEIHKKLDFIRKVTLKRSIGLVIKETVDLFFKERPSLKVDYEMFKSSQAGSKTKETEGTGTGGLAENESKKSKPFCPRNPKR